MIERTSRLAAIGALVLAPLACQEGATTRPEGTAPVRVSIARVDGARGSLSPNDGAAFASTREADGLASVEEIEGVAARVDLNAVESIDVTLTGVQVHANATTTGDGNAGWFDLTVESTAQDPVNLLDLSSAGITVARGDLATGQEINQVRLFVENPTITFNRDVKFPPGGKKSEVVCAAGQPCDLRIPSADNTGVKIKITDFVVGDDALIAIEFDAEASVKNVVVNARGAQMNPVLSASGGG